MKWRTLTPPIVLAASLLLTVIATWTIARSAYERDEARFVNATQATTDRIVGRLETYVALLRGGAGLFAGSETVTYDDFAAYAYRLDIQNRYPGIQGYGYTKLVAPAQVDSIKGVMARAGFPDFRIYPEGATGRRHTILYLQPLDERNRVAIGYDMFSDPTRREAMSRAWEQGTVAMSGRVRLVQEDAGGREQAGFLIYVPVYRSRVVPATLRERLALLDGFVYAPFRADDLFKGIFGTEQRPRAAFQIYDGAVVRPTELLHDSRTGGFGPAERPTFQKTSRLTFAGRTWTVVFAQTPHLVSGFWHSLAPPVAGFGMVVSLLLFLLTRQQVRRENELRQREQEFSTMVNAIPQLAWRTDAEGAMVWYNSRWYDYTGTTFDEVAGQGWQRVLPPDHVARVTTRFKAHVASGEPWEDTFPLRGRDGTYRWFLSRAVPIRNAQGQVLRWFGTNTDVTEQRQMQEAEARAIREQAAREAAEAREEELRRQSIELERSNRELQDFAYVASHDLQEPLRKISAFSDLLVSEYGTQLDTQAAFYVGRMQNAAQRMSRLIRDLLAFSRVTTKTRPFVRVKLDEVLNDVLGDLSVRLSETGGEVAVGALPEVVADPMQMRQLFQNLIANALKFHRPGVPPHVEVEARRVEVAGREAWEITVADNGIGFDEKYIDRIFSPFQRLHGQEAFEGTGIGLAICRRIVERHGGELTARSTPGEGSTFVIHLPAEAGVPA